MFCRDPGQPDKPMDGLTERVSAGMVALLERHWGLSITPSCFEPTFRLAPASTSSGPAPDALPHAQPSTLRFASFLRRFFLSAPAASRMRRSIPSLNQRPSVVLA